MGATHQGRSPPQPCIFPYFGWLVWLVRGRFGISIFKLLGVSVLAGIPMFVHGYLIVFEGRRLF